MRRLSDLAPGGRGTVRAVRTDDEMGRRLRELGLIRGAAVECLTRAPWGDPAAYRICGAVIALRREDAGRVELWR